MKLLVVEDEERLAQMLQKAFEQEGFAVDYVTDGIKAEHRILMHRDDYALIILDYMLPGKDGLAVCASARQAGVTVPILILTARDMVDDKVRLLNSGADDYLVKPFSFDELLARARSILRRPSETKPDVLESDGISLDRRSQEVRVDGEAVSLTHKEFMLAEYFLSHPNEVVTRDELHDKLWDFNDLSLSNTIDVHIKNLRRKIDRGTRGLFETVRGAGYKFRGDGP